MAAPTSLAWWGRTKQLLTFSETASLSVWGRTKQLLNFENDTYADDTYLADHEAAWKAAHGQKGAVGAAKAREDMKDLAARAAELHKKHHSLTPEEAFTLAEQLMKSEAALKSAKASITKKRHQALDKAFA